MSKRTVEMLNQKKAKRICWKRTYEAYAYLESMKHDERTSKRRGTDKRHGKEGSIVCIRLSSSKQITISNMAPLKYFFPRCSNPSPI